MRVAEQSTIISTRGAGKQGMKSIAERFKRAHRGKQWNMSEPREIGKGASYD